MGDKILAKVGEKEVGEEGSVREGPGWPQASETASACGWQPRRQAELLFPAQELPCQLDTGGWARAGLSARCTQSAL